MPGTRPGNDLGQGKYGFGLTRPNREGAALNLSNLHIKGKHWAEPFTISNNWLVPGRAVSFQSGRFLSCPKHHNILKIKNINSTRTYAYMHSHI